MPWRETILNNFGWKIFSVFLATIIWLYVDRQLKVRVEENFAATGESRGETVTIMLRDVPIQLLTRPGQETQFRLEPSKLGLVLLRADKETYNTIPAVWSDVAISREVRAFVDLTDVDAASIKTNALVRPVLVQAPVGVSLVKEPGSVLVQRAGTAAGNPPK